MADVMPDLNKPISAALELTTIAVNVDEASKDKYVNQAFDEVDLNDDTSQNVGTDGDHAPEDVQNDRIEVAKDQNRDDDVELENGEHRQLTPVSFKQKLLISICIYFNVLTLGMMYGQIGPALPDLQKITGSTLQQATWLFTGFGIGYMVGCILMGIVQDRVSPMLMITVYTSGTALCCGILPWMPIIYASICVLTVQGIMIGAEFTGGITLLFCIWREAIGPYHQVIYFVYAAGGFISPLYTKVFFTGQTGVKDQYGRDTSSNITSNSSINGTSLTNDLDSDSRIQYAFLISSLLSISVAIPFLFMYICKVRYREIHVPTDGIGEEKDKLALPKRCVFTVLGLFMMTAFITPASTDVFPFLITTFVIQQLGWTQQMGSDLTSIFYISYGVGSLIGIVILRYSTTTKLIVISYFSAIAGLVVCVIGAVFDTSVAIWVAMASVGAGMSSLTPTMCTWIEEHLTPVTGRIPSAMLLSEGIGQMLQPILLGYLMDIKSAMWFLYITLGCMCMGALCFNVSFVIVKRYSNIEQ